MAGDSGNALGLDGIKEFKIVAGTFQAEYGLAMGSQMVAVSKGGTNQFHGDAFEYLRNSALDANDWFQQQAGSPIAPLRKNQFGAAFGGPIRKDKTFFYAVYEGIRQSQGSPHQQHRAGSGMSPAQCNRSEQLWGRHIYHAGNCPDLAFDSDPNIDPNNPNSGVTLSPYTAPLLAIVPLPNVPAPAGGLPAQVGSDQ